MRRHENIREINLEFNRNPDGEALQSLNYRKKIIITLRDSDTCVTRVSASIDK